MSLGVSLYGLLSYAWIDFRSDTAVMILYFILPVLSFPVTLVSFKSVRASVALHWALALGYLAVYSLLDWRTCAELGYCQGVAQVVLVTFISRRILAVFAVAVLNQVFLWLQGNLQPALDESKRVEARL